MTPSSSHDNVLHVFVIFYLRPITRRFFLGLNRHITQQTQTKRRPTSFLSCSNTMSALHERLLPLPNDGCALWADALGGIRTEAFAYERNGRQPLQSYFLSHVWAHTVQWGTFIPTFQGLPSNIPGCWILSAFAEEEAKDHTGQRLLDKLRTTLDDLCAESPWHK